MKLNINQIENILPNLRPVLELWEACIKFQQIEHDSTVEEGLVFFSVVFQNALAQGKECFNYNENKFVDRFNTGVELINTWAKYSNWHFPLFINFEIQCIVEGEYRREEEIVKEEKESISFKEYWEVYRHIFIRNDIPRGMVEKIFNHEQL